MEKEIIIILLHIVGFLLLIALDVAHISHNIREIKKILELLEEK